MTKSIRTLTLVPALLLLVGLSALQTVGQTPNTLPSERPAKMEPTNDGFDHTRRDVMIPMRDGVKLHTVI